MIQLGNCEALLSAGCSLRCASCNHGSAVTPHSFLAPESMEHDLRLLGRVAHFDFHCLQGGEPLLNKQILDFMDVQERSGIADKYGLLTNGTLLEKMSDDFWRKAARPNFELRWSVYPVITDEYLAEMTAKAASFGVDFRPGRIGAFKPMLTKNRDGGAAVWKICPWKKCYCCHEGHLYHCPIAALFPEQFPELFDGSPPSHTVDGYPLETLTDTVLHEMLRRDAPLKSCEICTGAVVGEWRAWKQIRDRDEWIKDTTV